LYTEALAKVYFALLHAPGKYPSAKSCAKLTRVFVLATLK